MVVRHSSQMESLFCFTEAWLAFPYHPLNLCLCKSKTKTKHQLRTQEKGNSYEQSENQLYRSEITTFCNKFTRKNLNSIFA